MTNNENAQKLITIGYRLIEDKVVKTDSDFIEWHDEVLGLLIRTHGEKSRLVKWFKGRKFEPVSFAGDIKPDKAAACGASIKATIKKLYELFPADDSDEE